MNLLQAAIIVLFLSSPNLTAHPADTSLVWPRYPERARIRHVRTISAFDKSQERTGFFESLIRFFAGQERPAGGAMVQPVGIAVSGSGSIYVTDPGARGVHVFDEASGKSDFLSGSAIGGAESPVGIAIADDGTIYISDSKLGTITALDKDRDVRFTIHDHLSRPTGLCIANRKLYAADAGTHSIAVFDQAGKFLTAIGQRGAGEREFNFPIGLSASSDSLFVVDALNYRIEELDSAGTFLSAFGQQGNIAGRFASPKAVALDSDRNLYVTDALMDNIQIFRPDGKLQLIVGRSGMQNGEFGNPGGIAIGNDDRIYVVETLNKRIQIFQYLK
ncbi:MAG TPA: 6-bladed beta-propeller [Bacteroidota bacterium]|nr:6-bladed beta-propeller [Bacteroidota bacterium]